MFVYMRMYFGTTQGTVISQLKIQTVSALSIFGCRHKGEGSVVFYFYCFKAARYCGQEHVYKQVLLS